MANGSARGAAWNKLRIAVLDRDGWVCQYCQKDLVGDDATADHITAKNNGGVDELWNLVAACRSCNGSKSDRDLVRLSWINRAWLKSLP